MRALRRARLLYQDCAALIHIVGQDINDRSRASTFLKQELARAKFRISELKVVKEKHEISTIDNYHILCFGAKGLSELGINGSIVGLRGQLHSVVWNPDALVFPTFAPGYLHRNPNLLPLLRDDLVLFRVFTKFDQEGVVL